MLRWWPLVLFTLALLAALWRAPMPSPVVFEENRTNTRQALPSEFFSEKLPAVQSQAGPSSIARLPDGRLIVVWQENRTGEAEDTQIRLLAKNRQGEWLEARSIANRSTVAAGNFAYLSHINNPLIYAEGNWLHLYFTSHAVSDWRSATLVHSFSSDAGQNWSAQRKIQIAPGLNTGELRPEAPIALNEGELALPLLEGGQRSWLRLSATGRPIDKVRIQTDQALLPRGLVTVKRPDGTEFLLALNDKHLLAAGNPQGDRKQLLLWQSRDGGQTWQKGHVIEQADDGAAEFVHPFLLQATDGRIHLTYTWRRQAIKHLQFSEAWLNEAGAP